jgi:type II secretory pathway pseudopilin PulG
VRLDDRGASLLEAVVALAILGVAGSALATEVWQSLATVRRLHDAEERVLGASRFLEAVSLWPEADLDRHLGDRRNGPWQLVILRGNGGVYDVAIADSNGAPLLSTAIHRSHANP